MHKTRSKFRKIMGGMILTILLGGALVWALRPQTIPVEISKVTRGPFEKYVTEEGKTRAREVFQITALATGNLKRIELHPGDSVKEGELLAEIFRPERWEMKAPIAGRILRVQRESGGPIERGALIMEIADPHSLEVVAEILTEEALEVRRNAPVLIESWGKCKTLKGQVRVVEPAAFNKISALGIEEQRVKVIIDLKSPPSDCEGLSDGFRVNNLISVFRTENALTVPTGALFRVGPDWAVFQVLNGRTRKTLIKISHRNPERALVEEGLKEGDEIIVYPSDQIDEGTRVAPYSSERK